VVLHRGPYRVVAGLDDRPSRVELGAPVAEVVAWFASQGEPLVDGSALLLPGPGAVVAQLAP
jgi:hypothetical protein